MLSEIRFNSSMELVLKDWHMRLSITTWCSLAGTFADKWNVGYDVMLLTILSLWHKQIQIQRRGNPSACRWMWCAHYLVAGMFHAMVIALFVAGFMTWICVYPFHNSSYATWTHWLGLSYRTTHLHHSQESLPLREAVGQESGQCGAWTRVRRHEIAHLVGAHVVRPIHADAFFRAHRTFRWLPNGSQLGNKERPMSGKWVGADVRLTQALSLRGAEGHGSTYNCWIAMTTSPLREGQSVASILWSSLGQCPVPQTTLVVWSKI